MRKYLLILFTISLCLSCSKEEPVVRDLGLHYYPNQVGSSKTYTVDSIFFNDFTLTTDTYLFEIKDTVESVFTDAGNRTVYRVERYKKPDGGNWVIQFAWTFHKDNFHVEEQKNNLREVVMRFPVSSNYSWDANARNVNDRLDYRYASGSIDTSIEGKTYSKVWKIDQQNDTDPLQINTAIAYEHYAPNVGLVNKYERFVKRFTTGVPGDPVVDSGYVMSMRLNDYRFE